MSTYEERLASFEPKKQKSSKKSASKVWPHPSTFIATPSSLAHAGFYYDPKPGQVDNVTCFTCEHSLGAWTAGDDPFKEHLNVGPKCAWALARCTIEFDRQNNGSFVFTEAARLPTAKAMEKARAETFKGFWIHDQTKGHTANSRKMAKAGWIFNPGPGEESDIATCFYCGKSLDGWEEGDDPTHEHRTRVPTCPVFTAKITEQRSVEAAPAPSNPQPVSTTSSKAKATTKRDKLQSAAHDTATESDAPSQQAPKRGRPKKSAMPTASQIESAPPPLSQASVASSSKPAPKEPKQSRSKSVRSTSVSKVVEDEPVQMEREPSPEPKPKKGKSKKTKATSERDSPEISESNVAVSMEEEPEAPVKKAGKKGASKKKSKSSARAPSVSVSVATDDGDKMDVESAASQAPDDQDITPVPPTRNTQQRDAESLGGWESFQAANLELEELARELHIEGEFAAIGKKSTVPQRMLASSSTTLGSSSATLKPPSKTQIRQAPSVEKPVQKPTEKAPADMWAWREREKSVGAKSVVSETEMTEEEEVEKSLAGDDDEEDPVEEDDAPSAADDQEEDEEEEEEDEPPRSLAPSTVSRVQSTSASTTVSSMTKAKIKEVKSTRVQVLQDQDEEMADGETPKASRTMARGPGVLPPLPPMPFPAASFDNDAHGSNPFLVTRGGGDNGDTMRSGMGALMAQLEAPTLSGDLDSRALTQEEREMTLEEWIRYDVERRKELIRREGRKWIETFLESAEGMREKIRAM